MDGQKDQEDQKKEMAEGRDSESSSALLPLLIF
jgi:hypothetical protein